MQALDSAIADIQVGRSDLVLAGGVDALSRAPLLFSDAMVRWLSGWYAARSFGQKARALAQFKVSHLAPVLGIMKGLTDPVVGLIMGQTAENLAYRFDITREQMDAFSMRSHQRVAAGIDAGHYGEILPVIDRDGKVYKEDDGLRRDSSIEGLAKLKPFFDKKFGNVTPGNSSQITDGAAWLLLASEEAVKRHGLKPLARLADSQWAALDPAQMGLGPVHAATPILKRQSLKLNDLDVIEINEAFAAQVLACEAAWRDDAYCREQLGLDAALGEIDPARLNPDGGAIALGHPVGASGARIVLHVIRHLHRTGDKRGIAAICIGGGQGGAMLVETV
jgi:acetyl-CoA C-acetyltransferase